jgi:hypothetical protein
MIDINWPASGWVEAGRSAAILSKDRKLHSTGGWEEE